MKKLARALLSEYPDRWRQRYGVEFGALLEELQLGWRDVIDVAAEALKLRILRGETRPMRIVDLKHREIPHGYEMESTIEYASENGTPTRVHHFFRELDFGDSYETVCHLARDSRPAQTFLVSGVKGEVAGDFRTDRTEMIALEADGSVQRYQPQTVPVWIKVDRLAMARKFAGWTPEQMTEYFAQANRYFPTR